MIRSSHRRLVATVAPLSALALCLLAGTSASAQTISWNTSNGNWNNAANWLPNNVPDAATEFALIALPGTYTIYYDASVLVGGLLINNPGTTLDMPAGRVMSIAGSKLENDGRLLVNSNGLAGASCFLFSQNASLSGTGRMLLNAPVGGLQYAYLDTTSPTAVLTQDMSHTIAGTGRVYANLVNEGAVVADVSGRTLELILRPKTNNLFFTATNNGILDVNGITITQGPAGVLLADNGTVRFLGAAVVGGMVDAINTGLATTVAGSSDAFTSVTFDGPMSIVANSGVNISGGIFNWGTMTVNPAAAASPAFMMFNGVNHLDGSGRIVLNAPPGGLQYAYLQSDLDTSILTQGALHTISGTGRISAALVNEGLIVADVVGRTLELNWRAKTNNAQMVATGGGILDINGITVTQDAAAQFAANNGTVRLLGATVAGGSMVALNGGLTTTVAASANALVGLTVDGPMHVVANSNIRVSGGLINTGIITVNPTAAALPTYLMFAGNNVLEGTGRIVLNAPSGALQNAYVQTDLATSILTQADTHSIVGTGRIYANLVNDGLVDANVTGATLELYSRPKTNNAFMVASDGTLDISGVVVTQGPAGVIKASKGNVRLLTATINGGLVDSATTGRVVTVAPSTNAFGGVTNNAQVDVMANSALQISGGVTNNGVITINPGTAPDTTEIRFTSVGNLAGAGSVVLNSGAFPSDAARFVGAAGPVTQLPGHALTGTGRVYGLFINQGEVMPGSPVGGIEFHNGYMQTPTGLLNIHLGGALPIVGFDQINVTGNVNLAGTLAVELTPGYAPGPRDTYVIVNGSAVSGMFDLVQLPPLLSTAQVIYTPTTVVIQACYGNCDGSSVAPVLNAIDFQCYLNKFAANDPYANCDGSTVAPVLNANDFVCFLNAFAAGCQ